MFIARPSLLRAVGTSPMFRASTAFAPRAAAAVRARNIVTKPMTPLEEIKVLNEQRSHRPCSPELGIYQPQLTWYLSGLHRITGVAAAGIFYAGTLAYAAHSFFPAIDSAHAIDLIHNLPTWAKTTGKLLLAAPLTFHSFNGMRHLMWDTGKGLTVKGVYTSGYIVLASTVLSTLYLVFFV